MGQTSAKEGGKGVEKEGGEMEKEREVGGRERGRGWKGSEGWS